MTPVCIYIAAEDQFTAPVKIGITNNASKRESSLNTCYWTKSGKKLRMIAMFPCASREVAYRIEQAALERLRRERIKVRREMAWCKVDHAVGCVYLAILDHNKAAYEALQYEMFGEAA